MWQMCQFWTVHVGMYYMTCSGVLHIVYATILLYVFDLFLMFMYIMTHCTVPLIWEYVNSDTLGVVVLFLDFPTAVTLNDKSSFHYLDLENQHVR